MAARAARPATTTGIGRSKSTVPSVWRGVCFWRWNRRCGAVLLTVVACVLGGIRLTSYRVNHRALRPAPLNYIERECPLPKYPTLGRQKQPYQQQGNSSTSFRGMVKDRPQPYYQHRWLAAEYWDTSQGDVLVDVQCVIVALWCIGQDVPTVRRSIQNRVRGFTLELDVWLLSRWIRSRQLSIWRSVEYGWHSRGRTQFGVALVTRNRLDAVRGPCQ